jgi:hypothetical protein
MREAKDGETYFFVDEFGDPIFYDKRRKLIVGTEGCSLILGLGFVEISDPKSTRRLILDLQDEITKDRYLRKIPSVLKHTAIAFHANKDSPEVRYLMYRLLDRLKFKAQFVVSCKSEKIFKEVFGSNENTYYEALISRLFKPVLHRYKKNTICFSARGSRDRRLPLEQAILQAKADFNSFYDTNISAVDCHVISQSPKGEPCLSVIDYVAWAVQRAYLKGEGRYYEYLEKKISYILDVREEQTTRYSRKHPLDIEKAALLQLGSAS